MRLKDENKEIIIRQIAMEMIVTEGFDHLSMQKLAKLANISPSTIYVYFDSREDLVNKLYIDVQEKFEKDVLHNFSDNLRFEEGLWLQWNNRLNNIIQNPIAYRFYEQFRNSPLIHQKNMRPTAFIQAMKAFHQNAIRNKEIANLPTEIFWAMAYGPFYTLVKFHLDKATMAGVVFSVTEQKLRQCFELVIKALTITSDA